MSLAKEKIQELYKKYLSVKSLQKIQDKYGIDRKKLSRLFRQEYGKDAILYNQSIDEINKAVELYNQGKSLTNIAKELGIDRHQLSYNLDKLGIRKMHKPADSSKKFVDNEENQLILKAYQNGTSIRQLARENHCSTNKIVRLLREYDAVEYERTTRKYMFDETIFSSIDTEEKAYWLGFMYADGYVNEVKGEIEISLKKEDKLHLEKFSKFINSTPSIPVKEKHVKCNEKDILVYKINVSSRKLVNDLVKWGCIQNKSLKLAFFPDIPDELIRHFMRGYFDGDGCLSITKGKTPQAHLAIIGSKSFSLEYEKHLLKEKVIKTITKECFCGKASMYQHSGNGIGRRFYNFLYKGSKIYLERKYNLLTAVLSGNTEKILTGN